MVQINLLPEKLRHKRGSKARANRQGATTLVDRLKLVPMWARLSWVVCFFVILIIEPILFTNISKKKMALAKFEHQGSSLSGGVGQVKSLKTKKQDIEKRLNLIEGISSKQFSWARQFDAISDAIPEGAWIKTMHLIRKDVSRKNKKTQTNPIEVALNINGAVYAKDADSIDIATQFLNNLRSNVYISKNIPDLKMGALNKTKIGKFDVLNFQINSVHE